MKPVIGAFRDTITILETRYRMVRGTKSKIALWTFITLILCALIAVSYSGQLIKLVAASNVSRLEAANIYATQYLSSYANGELGSLVATTIGLAIVSVMIAPFTGTAATSLISPSYLVSVKKNERHRFTDSMLAQSFSSISLLQLLTLIFTASLLTIDEGRRSGIFYALASWPVLVALSTMFVWVAEYLYRRFGEKNRIVMLLGALGTIAALVVWFPERAATVFGVGTTYSSIIQGLHTFPLWLQGIAFLILFVLFFLFSYIGYKISRVALAHPDLYAKQVAKGKEVRAKKVSQVHFIETAKIMTLQLWRNTDIRKPTIMTIGFMIIGTFLFGNNKSTLASIVFIAPLMMSLAWGSNFFGILGNGVPWLFSKPKLASYIIPTMYVLQLVIVSGMLCVALIPATVSGKLQTSTLISFLIGALTCALVMTRSAISKAVYEPHPYKSGSRSDTVLPPMTILVYTLRFSLFSGIIGFVVFSLDNMVTTQLSILAMVAVWTIFRLTRLNMAFMRKPEIKNKIIFTVAYN